MSVQLPLFWDMPLAKAIERIAANKRWINKTKGVKELFTIHDYFFYYDHLSELFTSIDIWISDYIHILDSQNSILEMIRTTGLKPYLDRLLSDSDKNDFEDFILREIKKDYPLQNNGRVLFPFKRLFFIAKK
jgi:trans-aconitate 2-methyltransferase